MGYYYTGSYDQALIDSYGIVATVTATATLTAGTLGFESAPSTPLTFPSATLGTTSTQYETATESFTVADATGSGAGWNISLVSTQFYNASFGVYLSTTALAVTGAVNSSCYGGATCSFATNSVAYTDTVTSNVANVIFNAATNTGMGDQIVTPTFQLAIPPTAYKGTYTSTFTVTLASGP